MTDKLIGNIPENTNPIDADWVFGATSTNPQSWQKTKVIDLVKSRYNPSSGWVLKDGSISPYQAQVNDKLIVNVPTTGYIIDLPLSPNFGDELFLLNLGSDFNIQSATPNSFLVTGLKLYQIVFSTDWKIIVISNTITTLI